MSSVFAACLALALYQSADAQQLRREPLKLVTVTGSYDFSVEMAESPEEHSKGLMFRRALGERTGMLFVHKEPQYISMWMRNTYIPLDMIFILPDGKVHRIEHSTEPFSERIIESGERVTGVLEIAGGVALKIGLKPGDSVMHPHFTKK